MIKALHREGIYTLAQAASPDTSSILHQVWKKADQLGLEGNEQIERDAYTAKLKMSHVRIKDSEDELAWSKNPSLGIYNPKLGYKAMFTPRWPEDTQWWWKDIWKIKAPLKSLIFMWLAIKTRL
jgi:hypothetical protein